MARIPKRLEDRVALGAELLDRRVPNWHRKVVVSRLDIEQYAHCVIGQVFKDRADRPIDSYDAGLAALRVQYPVRYGFDAEVNDEGHKEFAELTELWRREVQARRKADRVCA